MIRPLLLSILGFTFVKSSVDEFCGYAPLCGDGDIEFPWDTDLTVSNGAVIAGDLIQGAEIQLTDCCKLKDTQPLEDCQIVNPSGESYRTITAENEICGFRGEDCEDGECSEYALVIKPEFTFETTNEKCCDSCTCFGDPQCIAFNGEENIWALCDGREVPHEDSIFDMCRITEKQCSEERDHVGNECVFLANDIRARDWTVGKQGSPCQPNPDSPPSIITMYEVEDVNFKLDLEQGERGIIQKIYLSLDCGDFELSAEDCISNSRNAWQSDLDIPEFFSYNDVVHGFDQHWSVIDPDSGISLSIRCFANHYEGDSNSYVPRINIEDLSDPISRGNGADGYCVSGEFNTGQATTRNTDLIFSRDSCDEGLQQSKKREIYRALCRNPSLPASGHQSCIYHFCNAYYLPLFSSIEECEQAFVEDLSVGFCQGITYSTRDKEKCLEQWFDLGAVETIEQFYEERGLGLGNSGSGASSDSDTGSEDTRTCTTEYKTELGKCESGILIQYFRNDQWNTEIAIPSDWCSDEELVLSYCDYQYLFNRQIRILQKTASIECGPINQCSKVNGFIGRIELMKQTPYPTNFPTDFPTNQPTNEPTPYPIAPTNFPTPFPVSVPTEVSAPTICPETPLCETDNENVAYSNEQAFLELDECCIETETLCEQEQTRTITTPEWYCGLSDGSSSELTVEDSVTGIECDDFNEFQININFNHEEECCQKCTCFGDPRCYSFDGSFEEFILCDGRTPMQQTSDSDSDEERCIIRKETCLDQRDHDGNACAWMNPNQTPPNFSDNDRQYRAENDYQTSIYGSPCRYDSSVSSTATVLMYETVDPYRVEVEQGERGYIQTVHLTTDSGEFKLTAERCLNDREWEIMSGSNNDIVFNKQTYGREILWTVEDKLTHIILKIRCTGTGQRGSNNKFATTFINVEGIYDWSQDRISSSSSQGFCVSNSIAEKALATSEYTDRLTSEGLCDNWNEDTDSIMKREVGRIITNNPGVTLVGTESAYREFCSSFFSPYWGSISQCVNSFMNSKTTSHIVRNFCRATSSREIEVCEENLQVLASQDGYKQAFREGYNNYVVNYQQTCEVKFGDLPETLTFNEGTCQTGVELQFFNPRRQEWVTYAAFPDNEVCSGYTVKALYRYHPKLFKNQLRLLQRYDSRYCNQCTQVSTVTAFFSFANEPMGSF